MSIWITGLQALFEAAELSKEASWVNIGPEDSSELNVTTLVNSFNTLAAYYASNLVDCLNGV